MLDTLKNLSTENIITTIDGYVATASTLDANFLVVASSFLFSFFFSVMIAKTYEMTHKGFSHSISFLQAIVLGSLGSCMVIMAIGNSLVAGLGLMGTMAIVRFRSTMKDPKDMIYIFMALAIGITCGTQAVPIAAVGTIVFCLTAYFLRESPFSNFNQFEAMLNFRVPDVDGVGEVVNRILKRSCRDYFLVQMREAREGREIALSYYLNLGSRDQQMRLLHSLQRLEGMKGLALIPRETIVQE